MSQKTREEVLAKLRQRYQSAGAEHKRKLLDQAQELLGYHRKSAIRALRAPTVVRGPRIITGRPLTYEPGVLLPTLRKIFAEDSSCNGGYIGFVHTPSYFYRLFPMVEEFCPPPQSQS